MVLLSLLKALLYISDSTNPVAKLRGTNQVLEMLFSSSSMLSCIVSQSEANKAGGGKSHLCHSFRSSSLCLDSRPLKDMSISFSLWQPVCICRKSGQISQLSISFFSLLKHIPHPITPNCEIFPQMHPCL